jgi:hypothetical protein
VRPDLIEIVSCLGDETGNQVDRETDGRMEGTQNTESIIILRK